MSKLKLIAKLDDLATSGNYTHDEVVAIEEATVMLLLGDVDSAINILKKLNIA